MIIRQFRDTDAEAVSRLIIRNLREVNSKFYPPEIIESIIKEQTPEKLKERARHQLMLVAEQYDEIIGTATINYDTNYFGTVFVNPDFHGQNIGKKLMKALEKLAAKRGIEQVEIHASINAVGFYEKLGYKRIKLLEDEIFGKSWLMIKKLSGDQTQTG